MFNPVQQGTGNPDRYCYASDRAYNTASSQNKDRRPHASYAELITMAIESSPDSMLTLKEIYAWINTNYPYFDSSKSGWQNSIRHNLSLNRCFYKIPRSEANPGKGSYWKINYEFQNVKVNYRNKRYNYKNTPDNTIKSLSDILSDNKLISDNIGVNEIPYKQTTIFNGNLMDTEEFYNNNEYYDCSNDDKRKINRIFSFK